MVAHTEPLQSRNRDCCIEHSRTKSESLSHIGQYQLTLNFAFDSNLQHWFRDIHSNPLDTTFCQDMSRYPASTPYIQNKGILSITEIQKLQGSFSQFRLYMYDSCAVSILISLIYAVEEVRRQLVFWTRHIIVLQNRQIYFQLYIVLTQLTMNQIDYSPNIVERIDSLSKRAIEKKRVLQDFIGVMQDRANLEDYYSRNLEKISESLTRLIHGKDQLKDIFLIMRNFVSIQAEQSRSLARSIKNEVVSDLQTLLNNEGTWQKDTQSLAKRHARDVRTYIDKLNQLRQEYICSVQEEMRLQQNPVYKQKFPKTRQQCESQLRGYIDMYNKYIEQYFSDIAAVQDTFTNLEVERRMGTQETAMKFLMFEVSLVRNIQYDLNGITQKLEAYNPRNDLSELFKEQQNNDKPLLCKLNFLNYQTFLHQQMNFNPRQEQPKEQLVQQNLVKNKIFDKDKEVKKKKQIFMDVPEQPSVKAYSEVQAQLNTNPLLLKMFQNAIFNNIVSDQAIQNLNEQLDQDISLMQSFTNSLEGIMALSINQEEKDGQIQLSPNGYVSMMRIIYCFLDRVTVNNLGELKNLMNFCKMIYKQQQKPDDDCNVEAVTIWQGLVYHKLFNDVNIFVQWGSMQIQGKISVFQQQQDFLVLNENTPSSESEFMILQLVYFLSTMQDMGCSHGITQVIQDQLMEAFSINDQIRERITSQIELTRESRQLRGQQIINSSNVEETNMNHSVLS